MNNMIKNKGRGRKKQREINKRLDDTSSRQVTFSKRRVGVFKKASELCVLTGAEGAVLCESLGGRVFAFGHPSVESVIDRYLGDKSSSELPEHNPASTENSCMHELKKQYLEITKEMEIEKQKLENVSGGKNDNFNNNKNMEEGDLFWWKQPFEHLEVEELEEYISSMEKLMNNLKLRANDLMLIRSSSSMFDASNTLNPNDSRLSDEYLANKNLTMKDYGLPDKFFTNKNLTMNTNDYGLPDKFFTNKNLTMNTEDYGMPDEFLANKDLTTKGYGLPDEFLANKILNFDDGLLDELLAINDPDFSDELDAFCTDHELTVDYGNNLQVPNSYSNTGNEVQLSHINANLVAPVDYENAVDLQNFDTDVLPNNFSFLNS